MDPDLIICPNSTAPESDDQASIHTEELTTRLSSSAPNSCTTSSSFAATAESSGIFSGLLNIWCCYAARAELLNRHNSPESDDKSEGLSSNHYNKNARGSAETLLQVSMEEEVLYLKRALLEKKRSFEDEKCKRRIILRLRTGLKVVLEEAHNTSELQAIELYELRRDVRLTHARVKSNLNLAQQIVKFMI